MSNAKIALVDDHVLLRNGLASLITSFGYEVITESSNGKQFIQSLDKNNLPDLVVMDINMPEMDGYETTLWLKENYPSIHVLALSMIDDDEAIIRMIRNGAKGYILKDAKPDELRLAIASVLAQGFYYSDRITGRVIRRFQDKEDDALKLNDREIQFLKLAGTELTYKEIAQEMHLSPRTIDGYRDQLFEKLNIKSRVGLVMYAIKKGIIQINNLPLTSTHAEQVIKLL